MIVDAYLNELQGKLNSAHVAFVHVANQLEPVKREQAGVCGEWSPKDVASHLVGWDKSLKELIVDTENFDPPYDVHNFNKRSVASRQDRSWHEVMQELETNFLDLQQAIAIVEPQMKVYPRVTSWLAGRIEDYEVHTGQLEDWLR